MQLAIPRPDAQRISVILGTVMLGYALARFVEFEERIIPLQALGLFVPLRLNAGVAVAAISAGLTAAGTDWLLRDHPARAGRATMPHLVLPALTAWILSLPLSNLQPGLTWWLAFLGAGALLTLVLWSEFHMLDDLGLRGPFASAVLIALAYAMFLVLVVTLQSINLRLIFLIPPLFLAAGLVSLRATTILGSREWRWLEALGAALAVVQVGAPLHYFAIPPVSYGVLLLGILYAYTALANRLRQALPLRPSLVAATLTLAAAVALAVFLAL